MAAAVAARGVAAPGRSGLGRNPGGGAVAAAQCLGDNRGRGLQDELAQRSSPAGHGGDADEIPDQLCEVAGIQRLAASPAGKQPASTGIGGGLQVAPLGGGLQQQGGERLGHRGAAGRTG
jgi:hypothetical protein